MILRTIYSCTYHYDGGVNISIEQDRVDADTMTYVSCTRNGSYIWGAHLDCNIYSDCGRDSIINSYMLKYGMKNKLQFISRHFCIQLDEKVYPRVMYFLIKKIDNQWCDVLYSVEDSTVTKQFFLAGDFDNVLWLKSIMVSVFTKEFERYYNFRF